jgi:farnesyl diphosphate synthase
LVSTLGIDGARARLDALIAEADGALAPFGAKADILRAAARFVSQRRK